MILPRVSIYDFKRIMNSMAILGYIIAASHVFSRALHSFLKCLCTEHYKCVYHHALSYTWHLYQANIFFVFWHFRSAQKYAYACINIKNYPIQYLFQYFWSLNLYWSYAKKTASMDLISTYLTLKQRLFFLFKEHQITEGVFVWSIWELQE